MDKKIIWLITFCSFCLMTQIAQAASWYGSACSWSKRKPITITASSASTDYQVLVTNPIYNETGLVGSWHFSEGSGTWTADSSGNSNTGTLNGPTWTTGKFGNGLSFDGSNDYVDVANEANFDFGTNSFSVEAWIRGTGTVKVIVSKRGALDGYNFGVWTNNKLGFDMAGTTTNRGVGTKTVNDNNWHHAVWIVDRTAARSYIYVDNTLDANVSISGVGSASSNHNLWIGNDFDGWPWIGTIDEVRIYNRALSASEISALYNATARLDYADIRFTDSNGSTLLNHWMEKDGGFWVKVPSVPSGSKTIYVYYGNPTATSTSNADNTFIFFDDFNDNSLDTNKWTAYLDSSGTVTETDGYLHLNLATSGVHQGSGVYTASTYPKQGYVIESKIMPETAGYNGCGGGNCGPDGIWFRHETNYREGTYYGSQDKYYILLLTHADFASPHHSNVEKNDGTSTYTTVMTDSLSKGSWYNIKLEINSTNLTYYVNGTNYGTSAIESSVWTNLGSNVRFEVYHSDYQPGGYYGVDDFRVRKYASPEPTNSAGAEETCSSTGGSFFSVFE